MKHLSVDSFSLTTYFVLSADELELFLFLCLDYLAFLFLAYYISSQVYFFKKKTIMMRIIIANTPAPTDIPIMAGVGNLLYYLGSYVLTSVLLIF